MKRTWRFWIALWLGKTISSILKLTGRKGTTLPGKVALMLEPNLIGILSAQYSDGIILVTGTNGKTTTSNLLANILEVAGRSFAFNRAGANLVTGIAGALLGDFDVFGNNRAKLALLEVDEATVPKLCQQVKPKLALVTNFFRDQLDRYGELDTTIRMVQDALPLETDLILNADDPLVARIGQNRRSVLYYGVESTPDSQVQSLETREARFCPECGEVLGYSLYHYGQLGIYACQCGYARPTPPVLAQSVGSGEEGLHFRVGETEFSLGMQGYYNLYNALAALATAKRMGIKDKDIDRGLKEFIPQAGRMEPFSLPEGKVTLTLVKNPTGFNQVIRALFQIEDRPVRLLIAINDLAADGRDISWLWDVDFEVLSRLSQRLESIICSGLRAEDMAVRLKYAGIPVDKLQTEHELDAALTLLQENRTGHELVYILPTYTLLFSMRGILEQRQIKGGGQNKSLAGSDSEEVGA